MLAVKIPGKDTIKIVEEKNPVPRKRSVNQNESFSFMQE